MRRADAEYPSFTACLEAWGAGSLTRGPLTTLQINIGRLCNQACRHCHVDAGPGRTEIMTWSTMEKILDWIARSPMTSVDITGGAPELNPHFRRFVHKFLDIRVDVTSRCNLTVLLEPGQEDSAAWYAARRVRLVCSLPCYSRLNVDAQRGRGVFDKSIAALKILNREGYGVQSDLPLDLVYNPGGAFLPPPQAELEADYKRRLYDDFGIRFSRLRTLANVPINRFARLLDHSGERERYERLLAEHFNPATIPHLMCRHLASVDWLGRVYDCDFNQILNLPLGAGAHRDLLEIDAAALDGRPIAVGPHCFACTAGSGSGCAGALT